MALSTSIASDVKVNSDHWDSNQPLNNQKGCSTNPKTRSSVVLVPLTSRIGDEVKRFCSSVDIHLAHSARSQLCNVDLNVHPCNEHACTKALNLPWKFPRHFAKEMLSVHDKKNDLGLMYAHPQVIVGIQSLRPQLNSWWNSGSQDMQNYSTIYS